MKPDSAGLYHLDEVQIAEIVSRTAAKQLRAMAEEVQEEIDALPPPFCPPSKGITSDVGLRMGLFIRKTVLEQAALRFEGTFR